MLLPFFYYSLGLYNSVQIILIIYNAITQERYDFDKYGDIGGA